MRHRITPLLAVLALLACSGDAGPGADPLDPSFDRIEGAQAGGRGMTVMLSGDQEVAATPVITDATGTFQMTLNPGRGELCYLLSVSGFSTAVRASHIHAAPSGQNGGIVVDLITPTGGSYNRCVELDDELFSQLWSTPENYYVNVHSVQYPGGEIRGQLGW